MGRGAISKESRVRHRSVTATNSSRHASQDVAVSEPLGRTSFCANDEPRLWSLRAFLLGIPSTSDKERNSTGYIWRGCPVAC